MACHGAHRVSGLVHWLSTSQAAKIGFSCFIVSNVMWTVWGGHAHAWALIILECIRCGMNLRGWKKNTTIN